MKYPYALLLLCAAASGLAAQAALANEDTFLEKIQPPLEQPVGHGRSALWALPNVATQYQPSQPVPAIREAMQAQQEGRFLDALIRLEDAARNGQGGEDALAEINLLRASFLLQGHQAAQTLEILTPLLANPRYAADAHALSAMAHLQQGEGQKALEAAQQAQKAHDGILPHLALSYALQGMGRLAEARDAMHGFNSREPQRAVSLAREAELLLTLDQPAAARVLANRARGMDAAHPYVVAVSGLVYLIDGEARQAKAAFEAALKRDPQDAKALFGLGLAETKLGNFNEGQKNLQAAHDADPGNALIITYLARAQSQAGQTSEAREHLLDAQEADPKDPIPWLYQAQAELEANRPQQARESLRQAQARAAYRKVYRGDNLLREDAQLFEANLAEAQRRLGQEDLAFHTLADPVGEKSAATLRNQADLLQGRRFGETARRSLLLQSLFDERPGNLPAELDIYGDGAGMTGARVSQHGPVSELGAQHVSYNNYGELFGQRTLLSADAVSGGQNTSGEQVRFGYGSDTLGLGLALRKYRSDGFGRFDNLDNRMEQVVLQWRPTSATQVFATHQAFDSRRGEASFSTLPWGTYDMYRDHSQAARLGLHHSLSENSELRALMSHQQTDQRNDSEMIAFPFTFSNTGSSEAHSAELQYRRSGADYVTQWGIQQFHGRSIYPGMIDVSRNARQTYAAWQQTLGTQWQLDAQLGWGSSEMVDNLRAFADASTRISRWLPRLGVLFTPDEKTHVRLAAWQGMGASAVGDATLVPATLAGTLLNRYGDEGKLVRAASLSADRRLNASWLLEGNIQQRDTRLPYMNNGVQIFSPMRMDESMLTLHWQPEGGRWAASLALDYERIMNDPDPNVFLASDSVNEQSLHAQQLEVRWFASARWTAQLKWSHNNVTGTQKGFDMFFTPILLPYQDGFNQVDARLDWKPTKSVSLTAGVRNGGNVRFKYLDTDRLNPRFSDGQFGYLQLRLDW